MYFRIGRNQYVYMPSFLKLKKKKKAWVSQKGSDLPSITQLGLPLFVQKIGKEDSKITHLQFQNDTTMTVLKERWVYD